MKTNAPCFSSPFFSRPRKLIFDHFRPSKTLCFHNPLSKLELSTLHSLSLTSEICCTQNFRGITIAYELRSKSGMAACACQEGRQNPGRLGSARLLQRLFLYQALYDQQPLLITGRQQAASHQALLVRLRKAEGTAQMGNQRKGIPMRDVPALFRLVIKKGIDIDPGCQLSDMLQQKRAAQSGIDAYHSTCPDAPQHVQKKQPPELVTNARRDLSREVEPFRTVIRLPATRASRRGVRADHKRANSVRSSGMAFDQRPHERPGHGTGTASANENHHLSCRRPQTLLEMPSLSEECAAIMHTGRPGNLSRSPRQMDHGFDGGRLLDHLPNSRTTEHRHPLTRPVTAISRIQSPSDIGPCGLDPYGHVRRHLPVALRSFLLNASSLSLPIPAIRRCGGTAHRSSGIP